MSSTAAIEDAIIQALEGLALFRVVESAGRDEIPSPRTFPSAYACFMGDSDSSEDPRPSPDMEFSVYVFDKNVRSEEKAAKDIYGLIDSVRDAFNGKRLGLTDIEPFWVRRRRIVKYEAGVIVYEILVRTRHYLPVPEPD